MVEFGSLEGIDVVVMVRGYEGAGYRGVKIVLNLRSRVYRVMFR